MYDEENNTKGIILATILCALVIIASRYLFPQPEQPAPAAEAQTNAVISEKQEPIAANTTSAEEEIYPVEQVLQQNSRIKISNAAVKGSIRVEGARFDDLMLDKYKQTLSPDSPDVELLTPAQTESPYFAEFGWLSTQAGVRVPNSKTIWQVKGKELTPDSPIVLEWNNGQGLRFVRTITLDKNYMFSIADSVENNSNKDITLYPYGLITHSPDQDASSNAVVHQGITGVLDNNLHEIKFKDLDPGESEKFTTSNGWTGFSDRYWFSAFILDGSEKNTVKARRNNEKSYQVDYLGEATKIAQGAVATKNIKFFAGAKEIKLLDDYKNHYNIPKFDLAVDFGWYYFLTKPFFYILDFLYNLIGNMGWAILLFAALLRIAMYPIAGKSYESMSKMKKLQPKIQTLQERYGDDKMKLQQETMALYRKEKINPAAGCLPLLIQVPVFFSLYKVLNIAIEIRHAPFIGWIKDLSAPDPLTISVWSHLPIPSLLNIGVWPIIMGLTMYIQQKLNPAPMNKDQARVFTWLPIIFTFMLGHFASGLVIYWTLTNILSIIQQKLIMKKYGV